MGDLAAVVADGLGVEHVGELFVGHARARVADGDFHIVGGRLGTDVDVSALGRELTGVVGQRVEHEERQHGVGLHLCLRRTDVERDALHLEALTALGHNLEELLQGEALNFQVELALAQLYPVGQYFVGLVDLVGQLTDIVVVAVANRFVEDAVDEGRDAVDERQLGALLQVATLVVLQPQTAHRQFVLPLFEQLVHLVIALLLLVQAVEEPE